jgi:hypothetical protein
VTRWPSLRILIAVNYRALAADELTGPAVMEIRAVWLEFRRSSP